jgi:hypothetical protein
MTRITTRHACAIPLVLVCVLGSACDDYGSCPSGQTKTSVYNRYGQATRDYVCVPAAPDSASGALEAAPPFASSTPAGPAPSGSKDPAAPAGCQVGDQGTLDVRVLPRVGVPPALGGAPLDGTYVLVQADLYPGDGGAPPFDQLRASVVVSGAKLALAAQITSPTLEPVESITTTATGGILTKLCQVGSGGAAAALVSGLPGATERAEVGWDGKVLYLVVHTDGGEIALLFASV